MKRIISQLCVLMVMLCSFTAGAGNLRGDVNGDNSVTITDVTALIDMLLSGATYSQSADCNLDNSVNISDVTTLIDYLLIGTWPGVVTEHEFVDLGLPSGTLWATCNIGASSPEDYGDYFAWGETEPKERYDWNTYSLCDGSQYFMTKYCTNRFYGTIDNKTELEPEDDAAHANWGPMWCMPSLAQIQELLGYCSGWTQRNGVNGMLFTGPNGASLFLPAAGCCINVTVSHGFGCYWSHSLDEEIPSKAYYLDFTSSNIYCHTAGRYNGYPVRAVRVSSY